MKEGLETIGSAIKESLRITKEASAVFPPLQSVVGGWLAVLEVFQVILLASEFSE